MNVTNEEKECFICKENKPKKKLNCNKKCSKSNHFCKECIEKTQLDGCPVCRKNIYYPNPNKENFYKNRGMLDELKFFEEVLDADNLRPYILKCMAIDSAISQIHAKQKFLTFDISDSDQIFAVCPCADHNKSRFQERKSFLESIINAFEIYRKITDVPMDSRIEYIKGRIYIVNFLSYKEIF